MAQALTLDSPLQTPVNDVTGHFTIQKALQGQTLREIEQRLGYHAGRLSKGALFLAATQLPGIDQFDLAGYTQVAKHRREEQYPGINSPKNWWEQDAYLVRKRNAMSSWSLSGTNRLIKVIPIERMGHYPPGSGIPQWEVTRGISCKLIAKVSDYPNGRFIPDEGFTPVRYT